MASTCLLLLQGVHNGLNNRTLLRACSTLKAARFWNQHIAEASCVHALSALYSSAAEDAHTVLLS